MCIWEARQSGRPAIKTVPVTRKPIHGEAAIFHLTMQERASGRTGRRVDGMFRPRHGKDPKNSRHTPHIFCRTERLSASNHWTGVLPKWVLHREDDHVGLKPLLVANREFLHIILPFVGRNDRTGIAKEITPHARTRWAVP